MSALLYAVPGKYISVTPNDSEDNLPSEQIIGFYIEGSGTIVVTQKDGTDATLKVAGYQYLPFTNPSRVKSTGTTATGIHAAVA